MFNKETILARLQNGEDVSKIANEITDIINEANRTYLDQKATEEAEKKAKAEAEAQAKAKQKEEDLAEILSLLADWAEAYYDISREDFMKNLSAHDIIELIESLQKYMDIFDFSGLEDGKAKIKIKRKVPIESAEKASTPEDIFDSLFKRMGW